MNCKLILTNSNTPLVRELYAPFAITEVNSKRVINCKAAKGEGHTDLIIRNYSYPSIIEHSLSIKERG